MELLPGFAGFAQGGAELMTALCESSRVHPNSLQAYPRRSPNFVQ